MPVAGHVVASEDLAHPAHGDLDPPEATVGGPGPGTLLNTADGEPAGTGVAAIESTGRFTEMLRHDVVGLPLPGRGDTVRRWATLARWGRLDLPAARLAEGHVDALAIVAEAGATPVPGATYGVWAARSGGTGARLVEVDGHLAVRGTVRFCSGAHLLDQALVAAEGPDGSQILDIRVDHPSVVPVPDSWRAIGMAASDSADVTFDDVPVRPDQRIGAPGWYVDRPGFWWGGAGVAAVWLGGAAGVLDEARAALRGAGPDPHRAALFGALHVRLAATDALLTRTAAGIDAEPGHDHRTSVQTARAAAEECCRAVLDGVPRLVGVAALTRRPGFEQRLADLGVYVRQHPGERDLAALGATLLDRR